MSHNFISRSIIDTSLLYQHHLSISVHLTPTPPLHNQQTRPQPPLQEPIRRSSQTILPVSTTSPRPIPSTGFKSPQMPPHNDRSRCRRLSCPCVYDESTLTEAPFERLQPKIFGTTRTTCPLLAAMVQHIHHRCSRQLRLRQDFALHGHHSRVELTLGCHHVHGQLLQASHSSAVTGRIQE